MQATTLTKRAQRIKACRLLLCSATAFYDIYGLSVLSHIAQFRAPSQELRQVEAGVLATICAAPKNALPRACLEHLKALGFKGQINIVHAMSLAARCRVALSSPAHGAAQQLIQEALGSDEAPFAPPSGWRSSSIVEEVQQAYDTIHNINNIDILSIYASTPFKIQHTIVKQLNE